MIVKNSLRLFVLLCVTFVIISSESFSTPTSESPTEGAGTIEVPYQISSLAQLYWIAEDSDRWDKHYIQTTDIDAEDTQNWFAGLGWLPIGGGGSSERFTGTYNGQGYEIQNLFINRSNTNNVGLFGHVGHESKTVTISNLTVTGANITGQRGTGILVGRVTGSQQTSIVRCSAAGNVNGTGALGGLVGSNNSYQTNPGAAEGFRPRIEKSWADAIVTVLVVGGQSNDKIGGLVGCNQKGSISNSYAVGQVIAVDGATRVGGFAGCVELRGIIINCFAAVTVSVASGTATEIGGFIGMKGAGRNEGTLVNCFFDSEVSAPTTTSPAGGTGESTENMKKEVTYSDWDFILVWNIDENISYPTLIENPPVIGTWTWKTNAGSTAWNVGANWESGTVPQPNSTVIIPSDITTNQPILSASITLQNITIETGSALTIEAGHTLSVSKELLGTGTINGDGVIEMIGNSLQYLPEITFSNLVIDNYNNVALTADITINSKLTLVNGLLNLNGNKISLEGAGEMEETESSRVYGLTGTIELSRIFNNINYSNIAGIGLGITSAENLGETTIIRGHSQKKDSNGESIYRWFTITPTTNTELDATLVFHYNTNEIPALWVEDDLRLFKSTDGVNDWILIESSLHKDDKTLTVSGLGGFSTWTVGNSDAPLPVTWQDFSTECLDNNAILVEWSTASEINSEVFILEKSSNGLVFEPISEIPASGNSSITNTYNIVDYQKHALTYYRIQQIDYDGEYSYSKIISAHCSHIESEIILFPNPARDIITISAPMIENTRFFTIQGNDVTHTVICIQQDDDTIIYNVSSLPKGTYYIHNSNSMKSFIIQ